jgi:hypothetical protein
MGRFRSNTVVLPLPPRPLAAQGGSRLRNCRSRSRSCKGRHSEWNGHSVPPLDFFYFTYRRSQIDRRTLFPSFSLLTVIGDIRCTEKSRRGRSHRWIGPVCYARLHAPPGGHCSGLPSRWPFEHHRHSPPAIWRRACCRQGHSTPAAHCRSLDGHDRSPVLDIQTKRAY